MVSLKISFLSVFAAATAWAQPPELPPHIQRNIRLSVKSADAVALVTVLGATAGPRARTVELRVDRALMGSPPEVMEIPANGFDRGDLVAGNRLLVGLREKTIRGVVYWWGTGRYELVIDDRIRDIPVDVYLAQTAQAAVERPLRRNALGQRRATSRKVARKNAPDIAQAAPSPCSNYTPARGCAPDPFASMAQLETM